MGLHILLEFGGGRGRKGKGRRRPPLGPTDGSRNPCLRCQRLGFAIPPHHTVKPSNFRCSSPLALLAELRQPVVRRIRSVSRA